jgi:hypothetical protein
MRTRQRACRASIAAPFARRMKLARTLGASRPAGTWIAL